MSTNKSNTNVYRFKLFLFEKVKPEITADPPNVPKPRSGHRIVCNAHSLYSFGGYNPFIPDDDPSIRNDSEWLETKPLFKELWSFNFATRTWKSIQCKGEVPRELASNAVLLEGNTLMVYGGAGYPFGSFSSNKLYVCNVGDYGQMQLVETRGSKPLKQYGQALVLHGTHLYTVGGTTGYEFTADVHRLDLSTGVWEDVHTCSGGLSEMPEGRYRHELAFDGTRIYVLGGGTAMQVFGLNVVPVFNVESRLWERFPTRPDSRGPPPGFPEPRRCHGAAQRGAFVFICGGYNGRKVFNDVWRLHLPTGQWTLMKRCRLPEPVFFHSAAVTPAGRLYSFGGISMTDANPERNADIQSAWLDVPSLAEMCWEAVVYYSPNLGAYSREHLRHAGFPAQYIDRIHA
uniref:Kelch domain-containing protein 10 n=2 Tax=Timema TaxID=61471 RepID=A0A7R9B709_TIMSH|nr:unnamed protein product [Timema shepardi]CAD7418290.1 unnamed protein product [Timema poppensis]